MTLIKTMAISAAVLFCITAGTFCLWAATLITHVEGWRTVQGGIVFLAICYYIAAILILEIAGRKARNNV